MANQNTIQGTLNWSAASILNRPTTNVAGFFQEPGLTNANWLMSEILGPPFAWQWNRTTTSFATVVGQSDYQINIPNYGWLEKATFTSATGAIFELQISSLLAASGKNNPPYWICTVFDDNDGNITFRLMPIPDQIYTVTLTYQKAPNFATSLFGPQSVITSASNAVGGITTYAGTINGGASNALAGQYWYVSGFSTSLGGNNGLYLVTQSSATSLQLQNPNGQSGLFSAAAAPATTWAPIPDKYNFLYETGMLARLYTIYDRSAYLTEMQMFYRQLVGVSEGLSDTAKAIFLEDKLTQIRTEAAAQYAASGSPKRGQQ